MKIENLKLKISSRGFTLIELLVAMAIIALLAAVVLVQFQGYAKGARASKALAQMSSAIPGMVSCWGNGKIVKAPSSSGAICKEAGVGGADVTSYGYWPNTSGDLTSYSYGINSLNDRTSWYFSLGSSSDNKGICCNSTLKSCQIIGQPVTSSNCTAILPAS